MEKPTDEQRKENSIRQEERMKRRKKGKDPHIYMTEKEKAHNNKGREEEHDCIYNPIEKMEKTL